MLFSTALTLALLPASALVSARSSHSSIRGPRRLGSRQAALDFGSCGSPEVVFKLGLDGRQQESFQASNQKDFNHGSALNIGVISSFICQRLGSPCNASQATIAACDSAAAAAKAAGGGATGASADAFNAALGITTNFAGGAADAGTTAPVAAASSAAPVADATTTTAAAPAAATSAAASAPAAGGGDAQTSLTLLASQVQPNLAKTGQETPAAGQVESLTSTNNFINFCATQANLPLTNGLQTKTGSCNPTPMGVILATTKMPASKFTFPANGATIDANSDFTIKMAIQNMVTGNFVNAQANYYAAPAQVDGSGTLIGHSHVVIQKIDSLGSTTILDPNTFAFFKGLNEAAVGGELSATVTGGLPAGTYRLASINSAANHQPALVAVAQHGSLDDIVYFTVGAAAGGNGGNGAAAPAPAASAPATAAPAPVASAPAGATGGNLQTFTGNLGAAAPAVFAAAGGKFTSNGVTFNQAQAAIDRSCSQQTNLCANAVNGGKLSGTSVSDCFAQETQCKALNF